MNSPYTSITVTTTTCASNTLVWANVPVKKVLSPKEQRKHDRDQKWWAKIKANQEMWFEREMARIHAEAEANAWRPQISNSKTSNPYQLSWWSLGQPEDESEVEEQGGTASPNWRAERNAYKRMWCGLTLSNPNAYERKLIEDFMASLRKKECFFHFEQWQDREKEVGVHLTSTGGFWFKNLDDHNRFVALLESIPARTQMFVFGEAADIKAIRHLLKGENYMITKGDDGVALTMPEGSNAVLAKMFVG
jgi:hypothetical protein